MNSEPDKKNDQWMGGPPKRTKTCPIWLLIVVGTFGLIVLITGIVMFPVLNGYVHDVIEEEVLIKNDKKLMAFKYFKKIPLPLRVKFYFFHVENPLEIVERGEKPVLTERGPYVYCEHRTKDIVNFTEDGRLVSYRERRVFHFLANESVGPEKEYVRILNVPVLKVLHDAKRVDPFSKAILLALMNKTNTSLFENKTVHEWLWGYNDTLLWDLRHLNKTVPFTTFGWFMHHNDSLIRNATVKTGVDDKESEGLIKSWNGMQHETVWTGPSCNAINGSDGTFYHSFIERTEHLYTFLPDLCRSIKFRFARLDKYKRLPYYEFRVAHDVFQSREENPENECFCTPDNCHCLGTGMLNISRCQLGAPVISSQPHMLNADKKYRNALVGLKPVASKHRSFFWIQPEIGMVLQGAKRVQLNGFVENAPEFPKIFQKFPNRTVVPVLWVEESATLDNRTAEEIYDNVVYPQNQALAIQIALVVIGAVLLILCLVLVGHRIMCSNANDNFNKKNAAAAASKTDATDFNKNANVDDVVVEDVTKDGDGHVHFAPSKEDALPPGNDNNNPAT